MSSAREVGELARRGCVSQTLQRHTRERTGARAECIHGDSEWLFDALASMRASGVRHSVRVVAAPAAPSRNVKEREA
eukprot:7296600-Prymnesium_polylepis.2